MVILEKELMSQVKNFLSNRELTGEVIWYGRLNSLKVKTVFGSMVQGFPAGTPDWIVIVKGKNEYELKVLFIECKSLSGKLRESQKKWIMKYGKRTALHIIILKDINRLEEWFNIHAYNFVNDLPSDLR